MNDEFMPIGRMFRKFAPARTDRRRKTRMQALDHIFESEYRRHHRFGKLIRRGDTFDEANGNVVDSRNAGLRRGKNGFTLRCALR